MRRTMIGCNNCREPISREIEVPDDFEIHGWCECERCFKQGGPKVEDILTLLMSRIETDRFRHKNPIERGNEIAKLAQEIRNMIVAQRFAKPGHDDRSLIIP